MTDWENEYIFCITGNAKIEGKHYQQGWYFWDANDKLHGPFSSNNEVKAAITTYNYELNYGDLTYD